MIECCWCCKELQMNNKEDRDEIQAVPMPQPHVRIEPHSPQVQYVRSRGPQPQKSQYHPSAVMVCLGRGVIQASQAAIRSGLSNVQVGQDHSDVAVKVFGVEVLAFGIGLLGAALMCEIFSVLLPFDRAADVPGKSLASISMISSSSSLFRARLLRDEEGRDGGCD